MPALRSAFRRTSQCITSFRCQRSRRAPAGRGFGARRTGEECVALEDRHGLGRRDTRTHGARGGLVRGDARNARAVCSPNTRFWIQRRGFVSSASVVLETITV